MLALLTVSYKQLRQFLRLHNGVHLLALDGKQKSVGNLLNCGRPTDTSNEEYDFSVKWRLLMNMCTSKIDV